MSQQQSSQLLVPEDSSRIALVEKIRGDEKKSEDEVLAPEPALPKEYTEALSSLVAKTSKPSLNSLSDEAMLDLTNELLSNLYATKDEWLYAGDWAERESELLKLAGSDAGSSMAAQTRYQIGDSMRNYLSTQAKALEWKIARANGEGSSVGEPELLKNKRSVGSKIVYGPVPLAPTLPGNTFEVWAESKDSSNSAKASSTDADDNDNEVTIVLGAGNQSMLTVIDVIHSVFTFRCPVLVKHHPLRPWLADAYAILLSPLTKRGYYAQVLDVTVQVTTQLLSKDTVGHVHITGSKATADAVKRTLLKSRSYLTEKQAGNMITSELGCCSPVIVDDGEYTDLELKHIAQIAVAGKKVNGGCNCLSIQALVLSKKWAQKEAFRTHLKEELKRQPTTPCYYPGSKERRKEMEQACKDAGSDCCAIEAKSVGGGDVKVDALDQVLLVECGTPGEEGYNHLPLTREAFGPVLAIVELDHTAGDNGNEKHDYLLSTAAPFVNEKSNIFGTLSCIVVIPASKYNTHSFEPAISALNYGCIGVNQFNFFGYTAACKGGVWGGHPSDKLEQSGTGFVGNQYGVKGIEKVVVYGPSLETRPIIDMASPPPPILMDVMGELTCTSSVGRGLARVCVMLGARAMRSIFGWVPGMRAMLG
eukprot:CAMPEP_0113564542 /NCGR_PEP_ID=MMETSP0015_2-20120614/21680_1 /TAXON_ID=2838 /ORGANISM="Odontella" /LENGTH=646 /DNA_ID=CAMNT_0000466641 /DNA_START=67 /DNA_END=2007 /DNA_ORIENTATION=- /assembly_acc=CAM_ASM_000160